MEHEGMGRPTPRRINKRHMLSLVVGGAVLLATLVWGGALYKRSRQAPSLLPASIALKVQGFMPYFYTKQVPVGYTLDNAHIAFDQGVLIAPLTKPGGPTIVLTEQSLPDSVSQQEVQQNGNKVTSTIAPATINNVEGRLLGTMIVSGNKGRTLILLNAPGTTDKADLAALLRGLQAVTR